MASSCSQTSFALKLLVEHINADKRLVERTVAVEQLVEHIVAVEMPVDNTAAEELDRNTELLDLRLNQ